MILEHERGLQPRHAVRDLRCDRHRAGGAFVPADRATDPVVPHTGVLEDAGDRCGLQHQHRSRRVPHARDLGARDTTVAALPGRRSTSRGSGSWTGACRQERPDEAAGLRRTAAVQVHRGDRESRRVVLMGDSNAWMLIPTFRGDRKAGELEPDRRRKSRPVPGRGSAGSVPDVPGLSCRGNGLVPAVDPPGSILTSSSCPTRRSTTRNGDCPSSLARRSGRPAGVAPARAAAQAGDGTIAGDPEAEGAEGRDHGAHPGRPADFDPLSCLSTGQAPATCTYHAETQPTPLERFYRTTARKLGATSVTSITWSARWPTCDPIINDVIVNRDRNHLTATFARTLASRVSAELPDSSVRTR